MGKGKRNREAREIQPITIGRGDFKAYLCNIVDLCDDDSFFGLSQLLLMACGVIDREGNLTEEYANSPYWTVEGGKLKPRDTQELLNQLSPAVRELIMGRKDD